VNLGGFAADVPLVHKFFATDKFPRLFWTIGDLGKPTIAPPMLAAMLIMLAACWLYSVAVVLARLRVIILEREQNANRFAEVNA